MPRFAPDNYAANLKLLPAYNALAQDIGCSPSQLALAWLLHKAPHIIPIPGTTSVEHLLDDLGAVSLALGAEAIARVEVLINQHTVQGPRYNPQGTSEVDTENFQHAMDEPGQSTCAYRIDWPCLTAQGLEAGEH